MVKSYLRYEPAVAFGIIVSVDSNISYDNTGKHLFAPALEKLQQWNVRQGICTKSLLPSTPFPGPSLGVTFVASSNSSLVASGYADGSIRIWDSEKGVCETTLNGHKGAVSSLRYNKLGNLLASGSKDNDVILWDVVGETGLFRLRGHRDQVTDIAFLDSSKKLVSSSKDKFMRIWDLDTQHCIQIISGHHSEIWSIDVDPEERYLVTGSADAELRFYTIKHELERTESVKSEESASQTKWEVLKFSGEIQRQSKDRVGTVRFNKFGNLLACHAAGRTVEIFRVLDEAESKRKAKRRVNRKKEKKSSAKVVSEQIENGKMNPGLVEERSTLTVTVSDVFKLLQVLRADKKICSISFCPITTKNSLATLALSLNNNAIEIYSIETSAPSKKLAIELPGHRSVVRSVTLSSDNTLLMSTSHNAVKIWNPSTGSCLRTIDSGYGLCGTFVPGDKFALVGTKSGTLEIIDVGNGTCMEVVEAHGGSIPSIVTLPDNSGFVTGSEDHDVKFWEYQLIQKPGQDSKQLTVKNSRTMTMKDDVLVVVVSPDSKYIAVALLDNRVEGSDIGGNALPMRVPILDKASIITTIIELEGACIGGGSLQPIYYMDTLKIFQTLYGHNMPVVCMDVSSDGELIVTGSLDKNLRIWGLLFGDIHRSLFAHVDSVMAVQFVQNTHYVFSVGKDRTVKYWDADNFELLLTLEGHHAGVCCLSISNRGDFIITGSHDRSMRRWDRTEEPFFIEEEKEKEMEKKFEADFDNSFENRFAMKEEVPEEGVVGLVGKKTLETLTAADLILDALDTAGVELKRITQHKDEKADEKAAGRAGDFQPNIIMLGLSPSDYVLRAFSNVRTNDLDQTLLSLPFSDALNLMNYLKDWASSPDKVEMVGRVVTILLQTHHNQLVATPAARSILTNLEVVQARVKECKDTIGFNLAAMDHFKQLLSSKSDALFQDAKRKVQEIRSQKSKRLDARTTTKEERRRMKKRKTSNEKLTEA
ncbi:hypothetical protein GIB67_017199 [Kingdonia uniflora]|uniref:Small-subunit processome Utp12 domain-containing protein n=1 Tax=Kingdonia uniflora TaxID=39325 RepID=A0A7J7NL61_9MAGN|nr:hypothetical protein GIB67_017199 [Kingdonia uniflora]